MNTFRKNFYASRTVKAAGLTVDEYLEFCEKSGTQPERPFKGSYNVRIQPELHRKAALAAAVRGLSLNAFVEDAIRNNVNQS